MPSKRNQFSGEIDFSQIPMATSPKGCVPNCINPPSLQPVVYVMATIMISLAVIFILLRLASIFKSTRKLGAADYFCIVAFIFTTGYTGTTVSFSGPMRHAWDSPLSTLSENYVRKVIATGCLSAASGWFTRAAIFSLYIHLFGRVNWLRWSCYIGLVLLLIVYVTAIPIFIIYHVPTAEQAIQNQSGAQPVSYMSLAMSITGLASDVFLIILPLPVISSLSLSTKKKAGVVGVFMTGVLAVVASSICLYYRVQLIKTVSGDPTWWGGISYITGFIENYVVIIVSCMPACSSLWKNSVKDSTWFARLVSSISWAASRLTTVSHWTRGTHSLYSGESTTELRSLEESGVKPTIRMSSIQRDFKVNNDSSIHSVSADLYSGRK